MVENYELLSNAIIEQAVEDYRDALARQYWDTIKMQSDINELERFFTGNYITNFTDADGPRLMKQVKQEVIDFNYDLKALRKSHQKVV